MPGSSHVGSTLDPDLVTGEAEKGRQHRRQDAGVKVRRVGVCAEGCLVRIPLTLSAQSDKTRTAAPALIAHVAHPARSELFIMERTPPITATSVGSVHSPTPAPDPDLADRRFDVGRGGEASLRFVADPRTAPFDRTRICSRSTAAGRAAARLHELLRISLSRCPSKVSCAARRPAHGF